MACRLINLRLLAFGNCNIAYLHLLVKRKCKRKSRFFVNKAAIQYKGGKCLDHVHQDNGTRRPISRSASPGNDHHRNPPAGQQIRKPPNLHPEARRPVRVGKSPAKVADLRAVKSLVIVEKSKVAGKSPAKVAHSSESEDS